MLTANNLLQYSSITKQPLWLHIIAYLGGSGWFPNRSEPFSLGFRSHVLDHMPSSRAWLTMRSSCDPSLLASQILITVDKSLWHRRRCSLLQPWGCGLYSCLLPIIKKKKSNYCCWHHYLLLPYWSSHLFQKDEICFMMMIINHLSFPFELIKRFSFLLSSNCTGETHALGSWTIRATLERSRDCTDSSPWSLIMDSWVPDFRKFVQERQI